MGRGSNRACLMNIYAPEIRDVFAMSCFNNRFNGAPSNSLTKGLYLKLRSEVHI